MKIMVVMKGFRDREGNFTEARAEELRLRGHETSLATSVEAAQKTVNDGWCPEIIIVDNKVENANLFVKQMRSRFAQALIYMVVENETADAATPERLSLDGFIVGSLKVEDILELAGGESPPGAEEEDLADTEKPGTAAAPAAEASMVRRMSRYVKAEPCRGEGKDRKGAARAFARLTGRKASATEAGSRDGSGYTQPATGSPVGQRAAVGAQERPHLRSLAFSALLGVFALAAMMIYIAAKPAAVIEQPALTSYYGMTLEQAVEALERTGKRFEIIEARSPEGTDLIISQDPAAGTPLEEVERIQVMLDRKTEGAPETLGEEAMIEEANSGGGELPAESTAAATAVPQAPAVPEPPPRTAASRPQVSLSATPTRGPSSGFIVTLHASAQDPDGGEIVSYSWSCGGSGPRASCEMVSSVAPATRTITCTVTDDEGQTASAAVTITLY